MHNHMYLAQAAESSSQGSRDVRDRSLAKQSSHLRSLHLHSGPEESDFPRKGIYHLGMYCSNDVTHHLV